MYGAILGDIISFQRKFDDEGICYLSDNKAKFTDHTVTMIAMADALTSRDGDIKPLEQEIRQSLIRWGKAYWNTNYSSHFKKWLANPKPIKKFDNGAAVRATVIPRLCKDYDRICELAKLSADITHGDIENRNDASLAALAVFGSMRASGKNGTRTNFEHELGC